MKSQKIQLINDSTHRTAFAIAAGFGVLKVVFASFFYIFFNLMGWGIPKAEIKSLRFR